jgi:hypothetical protein
VSIDLLQNKCGKVGTCFGRDGQYPDRQKQGKSGQFYGILFRRQDRVAGKGEFLRAEAVMIGESMLGKTQPHRAQSIEEALRSTDAGYGVQFHPCQVGTAAFQQRIIEAMKALVSQSHRKHGSLKSRRWRHGDSVENHGIHLGQAHDRLAQGARGQTPAVHHPALVEHGDLDHAIQTIVLQTVIGKNQITVRMPGQKSAGRCHPVPADKDRTTAALRQQQGFVTDSAGITAGGYFRHMRGITTITTTDNSRMPPERGQSPRQMNHQGRLAGTADAYVADHNHGHREALAMEEAGAVQGSPQGNEHREQQRKGKQQTGP